MPGVFFKTGGKSIKLSTPDFSKRIRVLKEVSGIIAGLDPADPPPVTATKVFKSVIETTGNRDAYSELTEESNRGVRKLIKRVRELVARSGDSFLIAVKICLVVI